MNIAIFDTETDSFSSLLSEIKELFCIAIKLNDEPIKCYTNIPNPSGDGDLARAFDILSNADLIVGHNIASFDIPVIDNILGILSTPICDTLIDSKLCYPKDILADIDRGIKAFPASLVGSYSLKAFGYRFGLNKIEFSDFDGISAEMIEYCKRDVELTYKLYKHLISLEHYPSKEIRECEYKTARIILDQKEYGFYFDYDKAMQLATKLKFEKMNIEHKLLKIFKPILVADGDVITPKTSRNTKQYIPVKLDPFLNLRPYKELLSIDRYGRYKRYKYRFRPYPFKIIKSKILGQYQKLKLLRFNPASRQQIVDRLMRDYGYKPKLYTPKGNIKLEVE